MHGKKDQRNLEKEIITDVIDILESFDPTPNKQYTLQIVKWFLYNGSKAFPKIEDGQVYSQRVPVLLSKT